MTLWAQRLESLLPEALGKALDVIPLESQTPPVANGATVVVLFEQFGLLLPGKVYPFSVAQQSL